MMPAVAILAGGLATRLRPITETVPKALIEVAGRPFIDHQLAYLAGQGIAQVVLCVGYLGEQIQGVVGDGSTWRLAVQYVFDGPHLLGTGGALRQALPLLGQRFFVLYGDSYLPIAFAPVAEAFESSGCPALMTVLRNADRWDTSNVEYADGRIVEYNKRVRRPEMQHIDYGLGLLRAEVLGARPPATTFDLADVYHELSLAGQLAGYEVHERFYEIGSHDGLAEADIFLTTRGSP
jgi:NDP-sugar pyrophosphorylase family protein